MSLDQSNNRDAFRATDALIGGHEPQRVCARRGDNELIRGIRRDAIAEASALQSDSRIQWEDAERRVLLNLSEHDIDCLIETDPAPLGELGDFPQRDGGNRDRFFGRFCAFERPGLDR